MDMDQLQRFMALRQTPDETQPLIDSLAQDIAASSMEKLSSALSELKSIDIDPAMYIPVSRQYIRNQREQSRIKQDELAAAQQRKHQQELHDLEIEARTRQLASLYPVTTPVTTP